MKLFKLKVTGNREDFKIEYNYSTNFGIDYSACNYEGSQQEKYDKFYEDLKTNGSASPINIKVKMTIQNVDRAFLKKEVLKFTKVDSFIERLGR
ncbi:MAG: hypothetical protein PHX70_01505 [Clostridium sp.]|nr:hypothetical protein [Clostridium sp.]